MKPLVAIIEDSKIMRNLFDLKLSDLNIVIDYFEVPDEFYKSSKIYDLIILDNNLKSNRSGLKMVRRIKEQTPDTIICACSSDKLACLDMLDEGAETFLTKPLCENDFETIKTFLKNL